MPSSGPIQTLPAGLLSYLQLKNQGRNPPFLGDTVTPVIDMTHWYHNDRVELVQGEVEIIPGNRYSANAFVFNRPDITVPEDEIWWVHDFTVSMLWTLGTTGVFINTINPFVGWRASIGGGFSGPANEKYYDSEEEGGIPDVGNSFGCPSVRNFWAPAGSKFGAGFTGTMEGPAEENPFIGGSVHFDRIKL